MTRASEGRGDSEEKGFGMASGNAESPEEGNAHSPSSARVAAVVVTYNRIELLLECIDCLLAQTVAPLMDVIVIDNASTDGTAERIASLPAGSVTYLNTGANLGGAGGFQYGMRYAVEMGYELVWVMDDDCMPSPTALEELLVWDDVLGGDYGFLCSKVLWKDGSLCEMNVPRETLTRDVRDFSDNPVRVAMASFVSLLVKAETIRIFGLPIKEFFIWTDDWEFTRRISRTLPCYLVASSVVIHKSASNIGANIATDERDRLDRYRYLYRNDVYLYRHEGLRGAVYEVVRLLVHAARVIIKAPDCRNNRLKAMLQGTFQGLRFHPAIEYCDDLGAHEKWLFYIDTIYQLLNCLLFLSGYEANSFIADAVIVMEFDGSEDIVDQVERAGYFRRIYKLSELPLKDARTRVEKAWRKLLHVAAEDVYAECYLPNSWNYTHFAYSVPCLGSLQLLAKIKESSGNPEIILIEDGAGSYDGNVFRVSEYVDKLPRGVAPVGIGKKAFKFALRTLYGSKVSCQPNCGYLHRPDLIAYQPDFPVKEIKFVDGVIDEMQQVFLDGTRIAGGDGHKVIIFDALRRSCSANRAAGGVAVIDALRERLNELEISVALKKHPQTDINIELFDNEQLFPAVNWEIASCLLPLDECMLVGAASTALLSPCLIFSKEPLLVILPVLDNWNAFDETTRKIEKMAETMYNNKERVLVPQTLEDVVKIIGDYAVYSHQLVDG